MMVNRKILGLMFLSALIVGVFSLLCIIFHILGIFGLILTGPAYIFLLIVACLSFLLAFISLNRMSSDIKYEINEIQEIERAVRDIYRYDQFLDPPDMDN